VTGYLPTKFIVHFGDYLDRRIARLGNVAVVQLIGRSVFIHSFQVVPNSIEWCRPTLSYSVPAPLPLRFVLGPPPLSVTFRRVGIAPKASRRIGHPRARPIGLVGLFFQNKRKTGRNGVAHFSEGAVRWLPRPKRVSRQGHFCLTDSANSSSSRDERSSRLNCNMRQRAGWLEKLPAVSLSVRPAIVDRRLRGGIEENAASIAAAR